MKSLYILLALLLIILWVGCNTLTESFPVDAFSYTSYDTNGTALVSGWFTLIVSDSGTVNGEWHFDPIGNPQNIGSQTGDGNLIGGSEDGEVWVELNPQFKDNNLQLHGTLEGDYYAGEWKYSSFAGITNQGTFEAIRK